MKKGLAGIIISLLLILSVVFAVLYISSCSRHNSQVNELHAVVDSREKQLIEMNSKVSGLTDQLRDAEENLAGCKDEIESLNNILEEFHTAQESAETVLENDRTDLASANAVQSEGILSAVTFSEMAVPADTTTPLNAAAYITRNAEILSSIAEDYSAKDSETASRMSAMQQAGAGLSETLASLAQDSSGVLDSVSGVTLGEAVTGAQETVGEAKAGAEALKTGAGEGLSAVGAQYEDSVARIREAVKEANRDTEEDAKDDVRSLVERLRDSVPGISVRVSPDGQACTVTPEGGKEEQEELPEITIAIEDPDREMVEDNVELMRLILSVVFLEKDRTTVVTTMGPAEESGVNDPLDETGDGTEDSTGDDDKEQPESIGTETVLEVTVKWRPQMTGRCSLHPGRSLSSGLMKRTSRLSGTFWCRTSIRRRKRKGSGSAMWTLTSGMRTGRP